LRPRFTGVPVRGRLGLEPSAFDVPSLGFVALESAPVVAELPAGLPELPSAELA